MKTTLSIVLGLFLLSGSTFARPGDRYEFIGSFESTNPFNWDTDSVTSRVRDWSRALIFEIERGGVNIEVRDIVVNCHGRPRCFVSRGGTLTDRRPVRLQFSRDLIVESVQLRSKPSGLSLPPPRVNLFLEMADRGW